MRYRFLDVVVDTARYELRRGDEPCHVEPQVFDVLVHLLAHRDRVVTKEELLDAVWGDQYVTESALTTRIKQVRRAVGDDGTEQRVVRTVHGRGYQLVADVIVEAEAEERPLLEPTASQLRQDIRFVRAEDGTRLACGLVGEGPPLVRAAHWITHLDHDWQSPVWHHWLVGLARGRTLIRYDERGCGLSEQDVDDLSFEAYVRDLETVVDALGLERFPLLGVSQGASVAIAYAARHPDRVSRLVIYGGYAQGRLVRASSDEARREAALQLEMIRLGWGRDDPSFRRFFTSSFIADAPPELWEAFAELLRRTCSAENAARLVESWSHIDVTDEATRVRAPTLVMHASGDLRVPAEQAHLVASLIPGARFVSLESRNHLLLPDEPAWERFLDEIDAFLA